MGTCKWCHGTGRQYVEYGSSLCYPCEDCNGTGHTPECDVCGAEYEGEYCYECYDACENCGERTLKEELNNGFCEECREEIKQEIQL